MPKYGEKQFKVINQSKPRIDGLEKVTGKARYAADIYLPGMIYGGTLRSGLSSAKVVSIDTKKALEIPGVRAVVTAKDLEKSISWGTHRYLTDHVYFEGNAVALVAADTKELVQKALQAIEVEYEELPAVYTFEEAMAPGAHAVHEEYPDNIFPDSFHYIRKGDVDRGFEQAELVLEREYTTQFMEHAYIEPEAVVAYARAEDGGMTVHTSSQNPYFTRRYVADMLCEPMSKVRIVQETLGGTFGGKEEGVGLCAARAAYLARLTERPVKLVNTREESILESAKRHAIKFNYKAGVDKDGRIVAWEGTQIANGGAFSNQTPYMNWRANAHSAGAYDIENIKTDTFGIFSNTFIGGAMRGFSSPQLIYAQEQFIDELAEAAGFGDVEFRKINCLKSGGKTATGTEVHDVVLEEMMDDIIVETDYQNKRRAYKEQKNTEKRKGIGMSLAHRSCGFGAEAPDASGAMVTINEDSSVVINSGLAENGQGLKSAYSMIAAEALGVPYESISFYSARTHSICDSGMTVASRGTVMGAQSVMKAAEKLNSIMRQNAIELGCFSDTGKMEKACGLKEGELENLKISSGEEILLQDGYFFHPKHLGYRVPMIDVSVGCLWSGKQLSVFEWYIPPACPQDHATGQGIAAPTFAYGCCVAEVEVDMKTGYVDVKHCTSSHDVGTAINPALIEGQVFGGIAMGQGYALLEEVEIRKGKVKTLNLDEYLIPTSLDTPEMKVNIYECDDDAGTYGAKSLGEPATEAVAAAIANAVANATGRRVRNNPAGLERVLLGKKLR
jgi:CO/xanthine dehydrogenase Mo-binding subunit